MARLAGAAAWLEDLQILNKGWPRIGAVTGLALRIETRAEAAAAPLAVMPREAPHRRPAAADAPVSREGDRADAAAEAVDAAAGAAVAEAGGRLDLR